MGFEPRLVNSVEITENSVKFSDLKNSVKFSTESFSKSLKSLKLLKILKFSNFHFDQWKVPEIVSKLQFLYHLEENKLELGEVGRYGWVEGEVSGIFWEISENLGEISQKIPRNFRNFREISGKWTGFTEIYWNYWNFEITENSVQLKITEIFKSLLKLSPPTEITETEITNLAVQWLF